MTSLEPAAMKIEEGINFILSHFEGPIWPRTISSHKTEGRQVLVYSKAEALTRFQRSNLLDCRINAWDEFEQPMLILQDYRVPWFKDCLLSIKEFNQEQEDENDKTDEEQIAWHKTHIKIAEHILKTGSGVEHSHGQKQSPPSVSRNS